MAKSLVFRMFGRIPHPGKINYPLAAVYAFFQNRRTTRFFRTSIER